jgi:hypothetical protein
VTSHVERALTYIGTLTLPDGRALAETLPDDPWIVEDVLTPILALADDVDRCTGSSGSSCTAAHRRLASRLPLPSPKGCSSRRLRS